MNANSYARPNIVRMDGYTPGEQPRGRKFIKLNTNENPYPPSPKAAEVLASQDISRLRLYPDPTAEALRTELSVQYGLNENQVICGNGSDDLLTMAVRTFVDHNAVIAYPDPSYSLYPVLTDIQGARKRVIELDADFALPADAAEQAEGAALLFLARPNAPTGNAAPLEQVRNLARVFKGVLFIDEAYADFGEDNCLELMQECPNVIVSRTLSKSYSLAGIRLGYAFASPALITQMLKVKDSYNVNRLTQDLALAAVHDQVTFRKNVTRIRKTRDRLQVALDSDLGFKTLPSQANFLFTKPPIEAADYVRKLRDVGILVRYFPGPKTGCHVRITIGTDNEMDALLAATRDILQKAGLRPVTQ